MVDEINDGVTKTIAKPAAFMSTGLEELENFHEESETLDYVLQDIKALCSADTIRKVDKLIDDLADFTPNITIVGQIKAGKTSLVNAIVGQPDLLPADVNPWTSVVTSLYLNKTLKEEDPRASFQFFDRDEWDNLISTGGRMGELSMRAGADDELQKVQKQISEMYAKSQTRLGRKFELLLGQKHNYNVLDETLIQRYVCMGDDFEELTQVEQQGRFADLTKSAELYIDAPNIPGQICLRDTPGVNDTFMVREKITLQSLRSSQICVVVLSAAQALSSVDMGLIRLVSNVKSRELVIFVNRIDELSDPVNQLPNVREGIINTLAAYNGPKDVDIVFGSAYWATAVLSNEVNDLQTDSAKALAKCAQTLPDYAEGSELTDAQIWELSGLPGLFEALSARVSEGEGARRQESIRERARNLTHGLMASKRLVSLRLDGSGIEITTPEVLNAELSKVEGTLINDLNTKIDTIFSQFEKRTDKSHQRFLGRALESLLQHLETHGEHEVWTYNPEGLRALMRGGYHSMRQKVTASCDEVFQAAGDRLTSLYSETIAIEVENFSITPPSAPQMPAPTSLGQTIALDLQTTWWKGWWKRRRGYRSFASGFYELIEAETSPIVDELKFRQTQEIRDIALGRLQEFLTEQRAILMDISEKAQINVQDLQDLFGVSAQEDLMETVQVILEELSSDTDDLDAEAKALSHKGAAA